MTAFEPRAAPGIGSTGFVDAACSWTRGSTRLTQASCNAPLKIAKSFAGAGGELGVCVMDCSPGLLADDLYHTHWRLEAGARLRLTNQSFTRVHPCATNPCRVEQRFEVGAGAQLDFCPEPVMLYRGAAYREITEFEVAAGGVLLSSSVLCAGRIARGESFAFDSYQSRVSARYDGRFAYLNHSSIVPAQHDLKGIASWNGCTHWGSLLVLAQTPADALLEVTREVLQRYPALQGGASSTYRSGIVVCLLGHHAWELQAVIGEMRDAARQIIEEYGPRSVATAPVGVSVGNCQPAGA